MKVATVPPQSFDTPPHQPGDTFTMAIAYDGTRAGFIAASLAYLAQAPDYITGSTIEFEGERINLSAELARNSNQH